MLQELSRDTLTQQAIDTIRRFIVGENLATNDKLPSERELSEALSVSRNIVREALSVLVAEGWVVKRPGSGIYVAEIPPDFQMSSSSVQLEMNGHDLQELREARAAIELGCIELLIQRISPEQIQQLREINDELGSCLRQHRSTQRNDLEFHWTLLQATGNAVLTELKPLLVEYFRLESYYRPEIVLRNPETIVPEHARIIEALSRRDSGAIRMAIAGHYRD